MDINKITEILTRQSTIPAYWTEKDIATWQAKLIMNEFQYFLEAEIERKKEITKETLSGDQYMLLDRHEREEYGQDVLGYNKALEDDIQHLQDIINNLK